MNSHTTKSNRSLDPTVGIAFLNLIFDFNVVDDRTHPLNSIVRHPSLADGICTCRGFQQMFHAIRFTALILIVLLSFVSMAMAQDKPTDSKPKHDGKIDVTYDKTENETKVRLDEMSILKGESESLSMILVGSYDGQKPTATPSEILMVLNASSKQRRYKFEPILVVTADGVVIRTRQMKNYSSRIDGDRVVEPLLTMMPYEIVEKMTSAKRVVFKINDSEYELTPNNLEALRDFAGRLIP